MEFIILVLRHIEETDDAYVAVGNRVQNHGAGVSSARKSGLITPTFVKEGDVLSRSIVTGRQTSV